MDTRIFLLRGLERPLPVKFTDDYDRYDILVIFTIYEMDVFNWYNLDTTRRLFEYHCRAEWTDDVPDLLSREQVPREVFCRASIFQSALNYCSPKATLYIQEIAVLLYLLKTYKDVQWVEREICRVLTVGAVIELPLSREVVLLTEENVELKKEIARYRNARKDRVSKVLRTVKRRLLTKSDSEKDEGSDEMVSS